LKISRNARLAAAASFVAVALAGCSTYAQPDTALKGVSYTGGEWDSKEFLRCVEPGANEAVDNGGETYYYPITSRTWDFSTRQGADAPPILVSTSNNQELIVSGTITFTLITDCAPYTDKDGKSWPGGKLQKFHDTIGRAKGAFFGEESTVVPQGWKDTLAVYLGGPAERVMDATGGGVTWQKLYSDTPTVTAFTQAVKDGIPGAISSLTGGEEYFKITDIQIDKPTVGPALKTELENAERAALAQGTASAEKAFAESFPGGLAGYQAYKTQIAKENLDNAQAECLRSGKCTSVPFPAGS
jgi:hypothetical protein